MRQKTSQTLYAYWNEVRKGRLAPERLEIQPAHIAAQLPDTFILERCDAHTYRFRLAGTRVCDRFGLEPRGLNFLELWKAADRDLFEHHLAAITETGRVGVFTIEAEYALERRASFEILVLPLIHTGQALDRLLCSLAPLEEAGDAGQEGPLVSVSLLAAEAIWPDGHPHAVIEKRGRQLPLEPDIRNARIVRQEHRQFRVYDGGLGKEENDKL
jgi:hypothetical protein